MTAPAPAPGPAGDDEVLAAWEDALGVLERDVRTAAQLASDPTQDGPALTPWTPPAPGGPVPDVLLDRVRELLRLQAAVRADLDRAMGETRADLAGLARTTSSPRAGAATYVDISA